VHRRKRNLEYRFKKTGSAKDLQTFNTHLNLNDRELRKSKSFFFSKTLSGNSVAAHVSPLHGLPAFPRKLQAQTAL